MKKSFSRWGRSHLTLLKAISLCHSMPLDLLTTSGASLHKCFPNWLTELSATRSSRSKDTDCSSGILRVVEGHGSHASGSPVWHLDRSRANVACSTVRWHCVTTSVCYHIRTVNRFCTLVFIISGLCCGWLRGKVVERQSLDGELSLSCARPIADRWRLMWVNRLL